MVEHLGFFRLGLGESSFCFVQYTAYMACINPIDLRLLSRFRGGIKGLFIHHAVLSDGKYISAGQDELNACSPIVLVGLAV